MQQGFTEPWTPDSVHILPKPKYVVLNTVQLIENLRLECLRAREISAVDFNDPEELDLFMSDLYNQLEHYTNVYTVEHLARSVNGCLDRAQEYTRYSFTPLQRHHWMLIAREIVSQTFEYGLRDTRLISKYEYSRMMGFSLILSYYDE